MTFKKPHQPAVKAEITISTHTFVRLALMTVATVALILAASKAAHALALIFISFFLALALNAPVSALARRLPGKRKGSRSLATTLSFLVVVAVLGAFLASLVPPLVKQTDSFIDAAPGIVRDFRSQDSATGEFIRKYKLQGQVDDVSKQLSERLKHSGGSAVSGVQQVGSSIFAVLTILALTFMMLVEAPHWIKLGRSLVPEHKRAMADRMSYDMYRVVKGFVNGQVTLAAIAAVVIFIPLFVLDVSYPVALMFIVFICGLIPMVGHTIGAAIVSVIALFTSLPAALIVLAIYFGYQQIENYLIQPRIQANSTNMSPLLVFASVVVGVSFGGLIGGLVAIPVAGCIRIAVLEYMRSHELLDASAFEDITHERSHA